MNIICPHCKTKLNIPDHKIPKDKDSSFKCPKCREKVQVLLSQLNLSGKIPIKNGLAGFPIQGSGLALVCMDGTERKTKILAVVERAGFKAETPVNILEACKKMEYHIYSLVLVDESFDQNLGFKGLSIYMNELDMSLRRRACFILISERFSSGDNMAALQSSVNYIIGPDGLDHLDDILAKILLDHRDFYTVFNESMKVVGKA